MADLTNRQTPVAGTLHEGHVLLENTDGARDLYSKSRFGTMLAGGKVKLSFLEAAYLIDKGKISLKNGTKRIALEDVLRAGKKREKTFSTKFIVFRDLRSRGYTVKTALKFGAEFRVYDRGVVPGVGHAKWIVYPVHETGSTTWYELSAKNRVAHSTKKRLLLAIVDDDDDVTYYEMAWTRP